MKTRGALLLEMRFKIHKKKKHFFYFFFILNTDVFCNVTKYIVARAHRTDQLLNNLRSTPIFKPTLSRIHYIFCIINTGQADNQSDSIKHALYIRFSYEKQL